MSKIEEAIKEDPKKLTSPAFLLARLWRRVLRETDMTAERFNELTSVFVMQPGMTRKQETDARGKLRHTLASSKMSLLALLNGLRLLKATRITFALQVEFQDRPSITVAETVSFSHPLHNPESAE